MKQNYKSEEEKLTIDDRICGTVIFSGLAGLLVGVSSAVVNISIEQYKNYSIRKGLNPDEKERYEQLTTQTRLSEDKFFMLDGEMKGIETLRRDYPVDFLKTLPYLNLEQRAQEHEDSKKRKEITREELNLFRSQYIESIEERVFKKIPGGEKTFNYSNEIAEKGMLTCVYCVMYICLRLLAGISKKNRIIFIV